jgi:predicted AlkP superfamily pyrophosphatase or phosphodiesterase
MGAPPPRRVVYIVVDGMRTDAFEQAVHSGRAPALAFLRDRASYVRDSTAVFPSITPAATAALITGEMPDRHRIPGMCWYEREEGRFVNYGQSGHVAKHEGLSEVAEDFLVHMNHADLSKDVRTLHERLDEMGLTTASINFPVFRGPHRHEGAAPLPPRVRRRRRPGRTREPVGGAGRAAGRRRRRA